MGLVFLHLFNIFSPSYIFSICFSYTVPIFFFLHLLYLLFLQQPYLFFLHLLYLFFLHLLYLLFLHLPFLLFLNLPFLLFLHLPFLPLPTPSLLPYLRVFFFFTSSSFVSFFSLWSSSFAIISVPPSLLLSLSHSLLPSFSPISVPFFYFTYSFPSRRNELYPNKSKKLAETAELLQV